MKKILITGGCGYVGSFVCEKFLKKNFQVFVVDNNSNGSVFLKNKNIKYYNFNFGNKKKLFNLIKKYKIENLIHLAAFIDSAESVYKPKVYMNNNFELTKKILNEIPNSSIKRILFASTAAVYGFNKDKKISEDSLKSPKSPYGKSKLDVEKFMINFLKTTKVNFVILRLFNVAGANTASKLGPYNSDYNHIFNKLIRNKEFKIFGTNYDTLDGSAVRDYVHPDDVSESFYKSYVYLFKNKTNEIFNCGAGKPFSVKKVVNLFLKHIDYKLNIRYGKRRPGDPSYILSQNKKIKKKLNINFNKSNLENIIVSLIAWKKILNNKTFDKKIRLK
jgi:UDP-glucose 4-epimerase